MLAKSSEWSGSHRPAVTNCDSVGTCRWRLDPPPDPRPADLGFSGSRGSSTRCRRGVSYLNPTGFSPIGVLGGCVRPGIRSGVLERLPYPHTHPKVGCHRHKIDVPHSGAFGRPIAQLLIETVRSSRSGRGGCTEFLTDPGAGWNHAAAKRRPRLRASLTMLTVFEVGAYDEPSRRRWRGKGSCARPERGGRTGGSDPPGARSSG